MLHRNSEGTPLEVHTAKDTAEDVFSAEALAAVLVLLGKNLRKEIIIFEGGLSKFNPSV